jgi:hypothetical protein
MMVRHMMKFVRIERHAIGEMAHPSKEGIKDLASEDWQMHVIMLDQVHFADQQQDWKNHIPGPVAA